MIGDATPQAGRVYPNPTLDQNNILMREAELELTSETTDGIKPTPSKYFENGCWKISHFKVLVISKS
jgi:hypothetical protein